jgi:hypothetical protein
MEVEIGTPSSPIVFTGVIAGSPTEYANNPIYLWNDKGGIQGSVDARSLTLKVLALNIIDELVGSSSGAADQTFTVGYAAVINDMTNEPLIVKVNSVIWTRVESILTAENTDEVYQFDFNTGTITFGNGITGKIPLVGEVIEVSYTPDKVEFGTEISEFNWLEVRSNGVINNARQVYLERETASDETHVTAAHTPMLAVTGVWLNADPNRLGTNYFTGGSIDTALGTIILGTALPTANESVLIDYTYTIEDDAEAVYTAIGKDTSHVFLHPIPSNNAKKVYLRITPPETTSPSGILSIQFRLRLDYKA